MAKRTQIVMSKVMDEVHQSHSTRRPLFISVFYQRPPKQFYLRFCFAKNDKVLLQAAEILCKI